MRRIGLGLIALATLAVVLVGAGVAYQAVRTADDLRRFPPPGELVDVGGFRLHLVCLGSGTPTVVMDAGLGDSWLTWGAVQPRVARETRTCAYDRAGYGYSDPGPAPRDARHAVVELHRLLANAHVSPPYVLVGHSLGGYNVRLFTYSFPSEVTGLVLVDPVHEAQNVLFPPSLVGSSTPRCNEAARAAFGFERLRGNSGADSEAASPDQSALVTTLGYRAAWSRAACNEIKALGMSATELHLARRPLTIPLFIVDASTRMADILRAYGISQRDADSAQTVWRRLHRELMTTSTDAHLVVPDSSGHYIQFDRPDFVVKAIGDAVAAAREQRQGRRITIIEPDKR